MEMRGVEPLSEREPTGLSPSAFCVQSYPTPLHRQSDARPFRVFSVSPPEKGDTVARPDDPKPLIAGAERLR